MRNRKLIFEVIIKKLFLEIIQKSFLRFRDYEEEYFILR